MKKDLKCNKVCIKWNLFKYKNTHTIYYPNYALTLIERTTSVFKYLLLFWIPLIRVVFFKTKYFVGLIPRRQFTDNKRKMTNWNDLSVPMKLFLVIRLFLLDKNVIWLQLSNWKFKSYWSFKWNCLHKIIFCMNNLLYSRNTY